MVNPTRKDKIEWWIHMYNSAIACELPQSEFSIMNHIIIDSVGISGLKQIKKNAWNQNKG